MLSLFVLLSSVAFAKPAGKQLEKSFECNQAARSDWVRLMDYPDGYSVWETEVQSKIGDVRSSAFVFLDPNGQLNQVAFIYSHEVFSELEFVINELFEQNDKRYGTPIALTDDSIIWQSKDTASIALTAVGSETVSLVMACSQPVAVTKEPHVY
jgi:hypothetical protein